MGNEEQNKREARELKKRKEHERGMMGTSAERERGFLSPPLSLIINSNIPLKSDRDRMGTRKSLVDLCVFISFRIQPPSEKALPQGQSYKLAAPTGPMLLSAAVDPIQTRTNILFMTLVS